MSEIQKYFERTGANMKNGLNTCIFAEVIKIDLKYMRVDVKVDLDEDPIIMQVPIAAYQTKEFIIRPPYQIGDTVLLIVSQQDIDPILFDGGEHSRRQHELDDAMIISGITPFTEPLSDDYAEHEEDFVISKRDFTSKIIIKKNGDILIETEGQIDILADKDINATSKMDVNVKGVNINLNC